jgi:hypothetical protein
MSRSVESPPHGSPPSDGPRSAAQPNGSTAPRGAADGSDPLALLATGQDWSPVLDTQLFRALSAGQLSLEDKQLLSAILERFSVDDDAFHDLLAELYARRPDLCEDQDTALLAQCGMLARVDRLRDAAERGEHGDLLLDLRSEARLRDTVRTYGRLFEHCYRDSLAFDWLLRRIPAVKEKLTDESVLQLRTCAGLWAADGCPTLQLTQEQAAAFAFTDLAAAELEHFRMPWNALEILIPEDFFGRDFPVQRIALYGFSYSPKVFAGLQAFFQREWPDGAPAGIHPPAQHSPLMLRVDGTVSTLWSGERHSAQAMYDRTRDPNDPLYSPVGLPRETLAVLEQKYGAPTPNEGPGESTLQPHNERILRLAVRIALNAIIEANLPNALKPAVSVTERRRGKHGKPKRKLKPLRNRWELTRVIRINMVRFVRDYVSSKHSRVYKVRWVRRGHWRMQACGAQHSQHKLIWIAPTLYNRRNLPFREGRHVLVDGETQQRRS